MDKKQLVNFITLSILQTKRVEDRLFRKEIQNYFIKLNKSQLEEIFSKKISKICTLKQALQIMKLVEKVRQNRK